MPKLSILIPSIRSRSERMLRLYDRLQAQCEPYGHDVEILVFLDNKTRSIGYKRQSLLDIAQGDYVTWIDDDDVPSKQYVKQVMDKLRDSFWPDVVTICQHVYIDGSGPYHLTFKAGYPDNEEVGETPATRPPWHTCIWRRVLAQQCTFPDLMYGEDWAWAEQANKLITTSAHIDNVLLTYIFDNTITEAK